jgi:hypothetical protein
MQSLFSHCADTVAHVAEIGNISWKESVRSLSYYKAHARAEIQLVLRHPSLNTRTDTAHLH